jgi:hypothetical protein
MLTVEQLRQRREFTASLMPVICNGTPEQRNDVFNEIVGLVPKPNTEWDWPMAFGSHNEPLIRRFYEHDLGYELVDVGRVVHHPKLPISATLDGRDNRKNRVVEIKTTAWSLDWAQAFYLPQFLIQRECCEVDDSVLVISVGGRRPIEIEISDPGDEYRNEMHARIASFMLCVKTLTPPHPLTQRLTPPDQYRTIDLRGTTDDWSNSEHELAAKLEIWGDTKDAADLHAEVGKEIRELVPADVGKVLHPYYSVKRDRAGKLIIKRAA